MDKQYASSCRKTGKKVSVRSNESHVIAAWLLVVLSPIFAIFFSYMFSSWSWGLMDDMAILNSGNNFAERGYSYFVSLSRWGVFRPTFVLHSAFFYTVFESCPKGFYIFKLAEICLLLFIWGHVAFQLTKKRLSYVLVGAITLSFHYFYDTFFYLSSHEFLGLIFLGICLVFLIEDINMDLDSKNILKDRKIGTLNVFSFFFGMVFLLCSFGAKETFVSCGIAVGISYYALGLKYFIKSAYTSDFSFTNFVRIENNLIAWFKKDFLNHLPWVVWTAIFIFFEGKKECGIRKYFLNFSFNQKYGIFLGCVLYAGFLLMLLPWNTVSYYAAPMGLFFAFIVTLLICDFNTRLNIKLQFLIIILAVFLNQFVCQYALQRESSYQNDTMNLMIYIRNNPIFKNNIEDYRIFSNAMEPASAIPSVMNKLWDLNISHFHWSMKTNDYEKENMRYYLYSSRFPRADISVFKNWSVIFYSNNWVVYRRP